MRLSLCAVETSEQSWMRSSSALHTIMAFTAATLCLVLLNLILVHRLSFFFDVCFVVLCLGAGLLVRPGESWNVVLAPPVLLLAVVIFLALLDPSSVAETDDGTLQAVVTGMARHSAALVAGYALFLGALYTGLSTEEEEEDVWWTDSDEDDSQRI